MNDHRPGGGNRGGEQDPAYGLLQPLFFGSIGILDAAVLFYILVMRHMYTGTEQRHIRWQQILLQLKEEYLALSAAEKDWISSKLAQIASLQRALDRLFLQAGGASTCTDCVGACCAKGHNHAGLPTVLASLQQGLTLSGADFSKTCPWLEEQGCTLSVEQRPYNCITFLCDKLEEHLTRSDIEEFYHLDQKLRACYRAFAERYSGGGMSGLLIQFERLDGGPFLSLKSKKSDSHTQEPE